MTTTQQPDSPLTRWAKTVIGAARHLNKVLAGI